MATSDKFIQSMLELLDKLIEYQSKNANLLGDIKSTLTELRKESDSILENLRDNLPEKITREQDMLYEKFCLIADKIEASNQKITENIHNFDSDYASIKTSIDNNTQILNANSLILKEIQEILSAKQHENDGLNTKITTVADFVEGLKSKKMWLALIVGAITALAGAFSGVVNAFKTVNTTAEKEVVPLDNKNP